MAGSGLALDRLPSHFPTTFGLAEARHWILHGALVGTAGVMYPLPDGNRNANSFHVTGPFEETHIEWRPGLPASLAVPGWGRRQR
jgi:hypothetical protein